MEFRDIVFEPHSDMDVDDVELVRRHNELIKQENYDGATDLLNSMNYKKGVRACVFNSFQNKIRRLEEYLLNKFVAEDDEYYSFNEPTNEQMEGKTFWIQPY